MHESSSDKSLLSLLLLNTKDIVRNPNSYMTHGVAEGLRAQLSSSSVKIVTNHNLVQEAQNRKPDALICFDGEEAQYDVILQIRKMGIPVVGWLTEDPYELHTNVCNQDLYDIVFTNERKAVSAYRPGRAVFLPMAASGTLSYYPVRDSCIYDACVAGTAWPERVEWCRKLREELPSIRWKFILHRPQEEIPSYEFQNSLAETDYRLSIGDICRVFNQSKVVISLKRRFSARRSQINFSPAPRLFETALSGTAQLAETLPGDDVGEYFDIDKEIETFQSVPECVERIRLLLRDDNKRREIAKRGQDRALRDHLYENRAVTIVDWVSRHRTTRTFANPSRRILVCVHSTSTSPVFGGMEVMTEALVERLKNSWSVFLLYPRRKDGASTWQLVDINSGRIQEEDTLPIEEAASSAERETARFKRLLLAKNISLVHFQHLIGFPLEIPFAASELGIPYTITWGDYYPVCHKYTLLNNFGVYCHPDHIPIETCDVCLNTTHGFMPGSQLARRAIVSKIMTRSGAVICLSEIQREIISRIFPEAADSMRVIEPFDGPPAPSVPGSIPSRMEERPLNVAVTGNFTLHKGADTAILVMNYYKDSPDVNLFVLGRIDPQYEIILDKAGLKRSSNIHLMRGYRPSERYSVLEGMDVALFLSIWPEGYPMTLEDLKKAGVPTIFSDIGEPSKQIQHGVNGWKVPPHGAGEVISILNSLIEDRSALGLVRAAFAGAAESALRPSYSERLDGLFQTILSQQIAPMPDRSLTIKQIKWLGQKMESYPSQTHFWANQGPVAVASQQVAPSSAVVFPALATPSKAVRRFLFYARTYGLVSALAKLLEWLGK